MKRFFLYALFLVLLYPGFAQEDSSQNQPNDEKDSAQVQLISEDSPNLISETEEVEKAEEVENEEKKAEKRKKAQEKPKPPVEIPNAKVTPDIDDLTDEEARVIQRAVREKQEVPLWLKDLRRAEIITFGSIPFTMLGVSLVTSVIQWGKNGFDPNSFPNPLDTSPNTANYSEADIWRNVGIAAGISLGIGITDFIVQMVRRAKAKKRLVDPTYLHNVTVTPVIHDSPQGTEPAETAPEQQTAPTVEKK